MLEESTDEPEIDEEFEEAKPIFKRYQILIKKLMKEKMMNRRSGQRTKDYVFERWKNDCGIPPRCERKDLYYIRRSYMWCSKIIDACSNKMEEKLKKP